MAFNIRYLIQPKMSNKVIISDLGITLYAFLTSRDIIVRKPSILLHLNIRLLLVLVLECFLNKITFEIIFNLPIVVLI